MGEGLMPKAKMADSVFTNLFNIPEYALQLYQALHPEDKTTTQGQIQVVTMGNVLLNRPYNDLGMLIHGTDEKTGDVTGQENEAEVEDKLLILCEAQSTWAENILVRMLIYWAQTIQEYVVNTRQNLYSSKNIRFPKPEFYVIYTGERKTKPAALTLSEEFGVTNAELKIRMIYDGAEGDIINQYVTFMKVYKEQYKLYGRTQKTVLETIRICQDQDVLKEYLESRRKEVEDIMMTLFAEETLMDAYTREIKDESRKEGQIAKAKETALELAAMGLSAKKISRAVKVSEGTVKRWLENSMATAR